MRIIRASLCWDYCEKEQRALMAHTAHGKRSVNVSSSITLKISVS